MVSDKTDLSDVGLCSLNKNEMLFNVVLCKIKLGRYAQAKKLVDRLLDSCPPKYGQDIRKLRDILSQWLRYMKTNEDPEEVLA